MARTCASYALEPAGCVVAGLALVVVGAAFGVAAPVVGAVVVALPVGAPDGMAIEPSGLPAWSEDGLCSAPAATFDGEPAVEVLAISSEPANAMAPTTIRARVPTAAITSIREPRRCCGRWSSSSIGSKPPGW